MAKCNNEACGYTTPKALETCPRCSGPLAGSKKDRPVEEKPEPASPEGGTAPPAPSEDGTPPPPAAPSGKKPSKKSRHK
jgi:hypothetical protein